MFDSYGVVFSYNELLGCVNIYFTVWSEKRNASCCAAADYFSDFRYGDLDCQQVCLEEDWNMKGQIYFKNIVTLELDIDKCIGCGLCATVCPHRVFEMKENKAAIVDVDSCMECGACGLNCPVEAINVDSGVGCAVAVLRGMFRGGQPSCDCCSGSD
jgi:NAD-dependent dihydropyrimidine dehydrogenase PreA subunit